MLASDKCKSAKRGKEWRVREGGDRWVLSSPWAGWYLNDESAMWDDERE